MSLMHETCENLKIDLAVEVLESSGTIRLQALGTSMLPTIWPGDVLDIERKSSDEMVPGAIVLLTRQRRFFIHRLIEKQDSHWITRGDALSQNDVPAVSAQVLGRVSIIHRRNRAISPSAHASLGVRIFAWVFCHCDLLRNIAVRTHSFWQRRVRKNFVTRPLTHAHVTPEASTGQVWIG